MTDELLPYYQQELTFLRSMGAEFAARHSKIAGRLSLNADGTHDPHVERIVEAFAYLNARIRRKLDDDFPEIVGSLLEILYPHYQAPTPSMAIVQFQLARNQAGLVNGYPIPRGETYLETEPVEGERCRFRTAYPVTLWPFELESASVLGRPWQAPMTPRSARATGAIRLQLKTFDKTLKFSQIKLDTLRFYLHAGQSQSANELHKLLFNHTVEIVLANGPQDPDPVILPLESLQPVGFDRHSNVLPASPRSFPGYRLLTEYFSFPEKFLFADLTGLSAGRLASIGPGLEMYFFLDCAAPGLEQTIGRDNFRLGCTPIVNLFPQTADPFQLTHRKSEYRIIPDARRTSALEVYSVDHVAATSPRGEHLDYVPYYSLQHDHAEDVARGFWHTTRRSGNATQSGLAADQGTEVFLSLVDLDFSPTAPADWTVHLKTTCLNRDLPRRLPFGGEHPKLDLVGGKGSVSSIHCLTKPTATLRTHWEPRERWRILSHLSLNHLSLSNGTDGAEALREILRLYDVVDNPETRKLINGISQVETRRAVGRIGSTPTGLCQGVEVALRLNEEAFTGSGMYLFTSVLDRFLGLYASINSFSRLVAMSEQRLEQGPVWRWPARAGERTLL